MSDIRIRNIEPADYSYVVSVINDWWGGRQMADMLPKLFFVHFRQTSFVAEHDDKVVGFIVGFLSQTYAHEAYIHFVGVHPDYRQKKIGYTLYEKFFEVATLAQCKIVRCVTSPINKGSIAFHHRMGFVAEPSETYVDEVPVAVNYDGKGGNRVLFSRALGI